MPHRTLSSSLRLYSSPLVPRAVNRSNTLPSNGLLPATFEANETDALLGSFSSAKRGSGGSRRDESVATDLDVDDEDVDVDVDIEAEQAEEQADSDGLYPPNCCWTGAGNQPPKRSDTFGNLGCDAYGNIHRIRHDVINSIDDPYSLEQLKAPRMNVTVVRPLVDKYWNMQDLSIIYCLLVNRAQFIREQSYAAHHQTVNLTRALLCEVLAEKVLRRYNEHNPGPRGLLKLANILVFAFEPFQGASEGIIRASTHAAYKADRRAAGHHHHNFTALEVAIISESKSFLASTACQKVVDAIYRGKVVYSPSSYIDIIPDRWKRRPISLYDPRRAPILNQYRLVVPRTRNMIEVIQFSILLILYIVVMTRRETRHVTDYGFMEIFFDIYAFGWILDQTASVLEHGWHVYTQNLWSFLDVMFSILFLLYFGIRMHAMVLTDEDEAHLWAITALDILSCAAPVLIPRLAFNVMSENMLFLSLRAMMSDFITLTILAFWCFAGFLFSLKWLRNGLHESYTISKWMIFVWFGLDGTGINEAPAFHPYLGPILMVTFAFLGNTLFLTILVSMLSNTFSLIASNAIQEIQYRRSVLTFLGVKSDALFAFMPPFNLIAFFILSPLKWILSPRMFHTVNVAMVRVVNLPFLILLSWYERKTLWVSSQTRHIRPKRIDWRHSGGPRVIAADWWSSTLHFWDFSSLSAHGDIQAVFDSEPPEDITQPDDLETQEINAPNSETLSSGVISPVLSRRFNNGLRTQFRSPFLQSPATGRASSNEGDISRPLTPRADTPSSPQTTTTTTAPSRLDTSTTTATTTTSKHKRSKRKSKRASTRFAQPDATDAALRKEFHDSEDEQEALSRRKSRVEPRNAKIKRVERKDSIIDYEDANIGALEANTRLKGLESRLARIEGLLMQAVEAAEVDADNDNNNADMAITTGASDDNNNDAPDIGLGVAATSRGANDNVDDDDDDDNDDAVDSNHGGDTDAETEQAVTNDFARETAT